MEFVRNYLGLGDRRKEEEQDPLIEPTTQNAALLGREECIRKKAENLSILGDRRKKVEKDPEPTSQNVVPLGREDGIPNKKENGDLSIRRRDGKDKPGGPVYIRPKLFNKTQGEICALLEKECYFPGYIGLRAVLISNSDEVIQVSQNYTYLECREMIKYLTALDWEEGRFENSDPEDQDRMRKIMAYHWEAPRLEKWIPNPETNLSNLNWKTYFIPRDSENVFLSIVLRSIRMTTRKSIDPE